MPGITSELVNYYLEMWNSEKRDSVKSLIVNSSIVRTIFLTRYNSLVGFKQIEPIENLSREVKLELINEAKSWGATEFLITCKCMYALETLL